MQVKDRAEMGVASVGTVYAIDQIMEALQNEHHGDKSNDEHYLKALGAAAVAIGAYAMLNNDAKKKRHHHHHDGKHVYIDSESDDEVYETEVKRHRKERGGDDWTKEDEAAHRRRLLEQAMGAYALGRELMGDKQHHIAHLLAEALGTVGVVKETEERLK